MRSTLLWSAIAAAMGVVFVATGGLANAPFRAPDNVQANAQASENPHPPGYAMGGTNVSPLVFENVYSHIPAQCYIETSRGTQNACQFCHTNGLHMLKLGNNTPQAGFEPRVGDLQLEYAFAPLLPSAPSANVNRWENVLFPEKLREKVRAAGHDPASWDMQAWVREDNWSPAFAQRPGDVREWDAGQPHPFRMFPGLAPADLPADEDGFVRSDSAERGLMRDEKGWITGWRSVNFMPYGIFTPMTGSVSGIYIRLPRIFMQNAEGQFDPAIYAANLDLLERAIQDRLGDDPPAHYLGKAGGVAVERGLYPLGTEFAHPLHYVDVEADGTRPETGRFPGTRAQRVKEVRYMYKWSRYDPRQFPPGSKEESAPIHGHDEHGWVDNGAGWYLAGFIEDEKGALRPQRREELAQCIGCHSGTVAGEPASFVSGTGNTIDSTWSMARKYPGAAGWKEMDYLGYRADPAAAIDATPGRAAQGDPLNRFLGKGEFRYFLETVVGASLYGDMPRAIEAHLSREIRRDQGYAEDWPALDASHVEAFQNAQSRRQSLLRAMTARGRHLESDGTIVGALFYPPRADALAGAARYRQVVVTQSYNKGKDVFEQTPVTFRYLRAADEGFLHQDGRPYAVGEVIVDRSEHMDDPTDFVYRAGDVLTLIDPDKPFESGGTYNADYTPLLAEPLVFEKRP